MTEPLFDSRRPRAVFSACEACGTTELCTTHQGIAPQPYRYLLRWPTGHDNEWSACFVLANPSTATADKTDPTVARCIAWTKQWGFGWCNVVNVRAWRETNPKLVPADPLAIGPLNDGFIAIEARCAEVCVCGWGHLGGERGPVVLGVIRRAGAIPMALQLNGDGTPAHPLSRGRGFIPANARPFRMEASC